MRVDVPGVWIQEGRGWRATDPLLYLAADLGILRLKEDHIRNLGPFPQGPHPLQRRDIRVPLQRRRSRGLLLRQHTVTGRHACCYLCPFPPCLSKTWAVQAPLDENIYDRAHLAVRTRVLIVPLVRTLPAVLNALATIGQPMWHHTRSSKEPASFATRPGNRLGNLAGTTDRCTYWQAAPAWDAVKGAGEFSVM